MSNAISIVCAIATALLQMFIGIFDQFAEQTFKSATIPVIFSKPAKPTALPREV